MRIGIIGSGNIIPFHIQALKLAGFEITSIAASNDSKTALEMAKKFEIQNYYNSTNSLLNDTDTYDALLVAPKSNILFELLIEVCDRGIPTLIEKPIFLDQNQIIAIDSEKINTEKIMVGYNRRYYNTVNKLKEIISGTQFSYFNMIVPELSSTIEIQKSDIASTLLNNTVHMLDLLSYLTGIDCKDMEYKINYFSTKTPTILLRAGDATCNIFFGKPGNYSIEIMLDKTLVLLKPLEELKIFEGMDILAPDHFIKFKRYVPKLIESFTEYESGLKPGFFEQSAAFYKFASNISYINPCPIYNAISVSRLALNIISNL
jgi:predicted dehydrogenase